MSNELKTGEMEYLTAVPTNIPAGKVLVHNHVRPTKRLGSRGFRAWLQPMTDRLSPCDCGFAPRIPVHYRVSATPDRR